MFSRLHASLRAVSAVALLFAATPARTAKVWAPPRTPDGHPDLQGYWTNATFTPLERPRELAGKEFFTEQEAIAWQEAGRLKRKQPVRKTTYTTTT